MKSKKFKQFIAITLNTIPLSLTFIMFTILNSNDEGPLTSSTLLSFLYFHIFLTLFFCSAILMIEVIKRRTISLTNSIKERKMGPCKYIAIDFLIFLSVSFIWPTFITLVSKSGNEIAQYIALGVIIFTTIFLMPAIFLIMCSLACRFFLYSNENKK